MTPILSIIPAGLTWIEKISFSKTSLWFLFMYDHRMEKSHFTHLTLNYWRSYLGVIVEKYANQFLQSIGWKQELTDSFSNTDTVEYGNMNYTYAVQGWSSFQYRLKPNQWLHIWPHRHTWWFSVFGMEDLTFLRLEPTWTVHGLTRI